MLHLTILIVTLFLPNLNNGPEWKLIKDTETIDVYARKLEATGLKEIRVEGIVQTTMNELVAALEDVDAQKEWVIRTIESRKIAENSPSDFTYYIGIDMPFPVKDRDVVIQHRRIQDPTTKKVVIESSTSMDIAASVAEDELTVRIKKYRSVYHLTPRPDGTISLVYNMRVDPGGALPKWLVNLAAAKGPYKTIDSLFSLVRSGAYSGTNVEGVTEI